MTFFLFLSVTKLCLIYQFLHNHLLIFTDLINHVFHLTSAFIFIISFHLVLLDVVFLFLLFVDLNIYLFIPLLSLLRKCPQFFFFCQCLLNLINFTILSLFFVFLSFTEMCVCLSLF